ncbi:unnamed protein product [Brassica napus]|uniref:(rape) hypothetical protein n=1 Tax=Brassica napus TaxID=3708 RepID=A0A816ILX9_BRANA|nr:unnamed protein product [Brassica napus]
MNLLDVHKWRSNTYVVDKLWKQVKRSLHEVPFIKNSFYGTKHDSYNATKSLRTQQT